MEIILIFFLIFLGVGLLVALVMLQLPLAYYLNDKWLKMKNRSTKIGLLICAVVGFAGYSLTIGSMSGWLSGKSDSGKQGTSSGGKAHGSGLMKPEKKETGEINSLPRQVNYDPARKAIQMDHLTQIARNYLEDKPQPHDHLRRLYDNAKHRQNFNLTDREWRNLRMKLAKNQRNASNW